MFWGCFEMNSKIKIIFSALASSFFLIACGYKEDVAPTSSYNISYSVNALINAGVPSEKIVVGVPFYGRGWYGVNVGPGFNGLFQSALGPALGTYEPGINDYKVLKDLAGTVYFDDISKSTWKYNADNYNFWSYDDPRSISAKGIYVNEKKLGGMMAWSFDGDTSDGELTKAMRLTIPEKKIGGYFTQWGIYQRNFWVKDLIPFIESSKLDYIQYAFANIYKKDSDGNVTTGVADSYGCDLSFSKGNEQEPTGVQKNSQVYLDWLAKAGQGSDRWTDIAKGIEEKYSVDGLPDGQDNQLRGNFNQLKKIKTRFPNLKIYISLGGWTYSRFFSVASSTPELRQKLVKSCIDTYIKGNIPSSIEDNVSGQELAFGIFDGIDIDWEAPGVNTTQPYNTYDPVNDKKNFVLLLREFRKQLDEYSASQSQDKRKNYDLSVAVLTGADNLAHLDISEIGNIVNLFQLMTYDYSGPWDLSKTGFHAPLYNNPKGPNQGK